MTSAGATGACQTGLVWSLGLVWLWRGMGDRTLTTQQ